MIDRVERRGEGRKKRIEFVEGKEEDIDDEISSRSEGIKWELGSGMGLHVWERYNNCIQLILGN